MRLHLETSKASETKATAVEILRACEVLKDILADTNIQVDATGLRILAMNTSQCALVNVKFEAENFEVFTCDEPFYIGVNIMMLYKLLKSATSNDILVMSVKEDSCEELQIEIQNSSKNSKTVSSLKLIDLDHDSISLPDVECDVVVSMQSVELQKIFHHMTQLSMETVQVQCTESQLIFTCEGDYAKQKTILGATEHGLAFNSKHDTVLVQESFDLKFLTTFCRSSSLSPQVEIYIKKNYPMFLHYRCLNLGPINFALAPKTKASEMEDL
jgi:proliferating cell nuclear antigen